jgi:hypothetical protein
MAQLQLSLKVGGVNIGLLYLRRFTGRAPFWAVWWPEQCTGSCSRLGKARTRPARMTSDHLFSTYIIKLAIFCIIEIGERVRTDDKLPQPCFIAHSFAYLCMRNQCREKQARG